MRITPTLSVALLVCLGCADEPKPGPTPQPAPPPSTVAETVAPPVSTPPASVPTQADRDPFAQPPPASAPKPDELARKAKKYPVEQLRLVGIVSGEEQPRAMFVDPRGKGWIVERGDRLGHAELAVDHFTGWRVDRIRADDVVLRREDATRADQSTETRVLALHTAPEPLDLDD